MNRRNNSPRVLEPGVPVSRGGIPLCVPEIHGNEWRYIKECLDTNFVSSVGPFVDRFERTVAAYVGTRFGVATVNGTSALHTALLVAGVEPGDEVLVPALTFIAPANAVRYVGAWPVFIDADSDYWQIDIQELRKFVIADCRFSNGTLRNRRSGRRVKAIIPVHILGHPCDMEPIMNLAVQYGLCVIEDATESLGAKYRGGVTEGFQTESMSRRGGVRKADERQNKTFWSRVGSIGHIGCFSFNGNKIITTGGGGMLTTNNETWAERARYLTTQAKDDPTEYVHKEIGFNYRMSNLQAAMGCAQMERIDEFVCAKRRIAQNYAQWLAGCEGVKIMAEAAWAFSTCWLTTVVFEEGSGIEARDALRQLQAGGVQARPLWQPLHLSPAHAAASGRSCPVAETLHARALSLPSSVGLTPTAQERVVEMIWRIAKRRKSGRASFRPCVSGWLR